jgi:hypothetical protein
MGRPAGAAVPAVQASLETAPAPTIRWMGAVFAATAAGTEPCPKLLAPVNRMLGRLGGVARLVPQAPAARLE